MHPKLMLTCVALAASLALGVTAAIAGTARGASDPGVTSTSILLGGTAPLTGPGVAVRVGRRGARTRTSSTSTPEAASTAARSTYKVVDDALQPGADRPG